MGKMRRMFARNTPYLITNRLAEGLPLVPNTFMNLILYGVLARASQQFPDIIICAWLFLQNHLHALLFATEDPHRIADFMNFVDGEIAKDVARLLGKRQYKIWGREYDALPLMTPEDVRKKQAYLYANPVAANLVARASDWFGVTTFKGTAEDFTQGYKYIRPRYLPRLASRTFSKASLRTLLARLEQRPGCTYALSVKPLAWLDCFPAEHLNREEEWAKILKQVAEIEQAEQRHRSAEKRSLPSKDALRYQNPHKHYKPQSKGRRVFCMCSDPELRRDFIAVYRAYCARCEAAWQQWKKGNLNFPYPPEAFIPRRPPMAALLSLAP